MANGTTQTIARDRLGRIDWTTVTGSVVGGGTGTLWDSGSYHYDGSGNIAKLETRTDPPVPMNRYAYDLSGRLDAAEMYPELSSPEQTSPYVLDYTYDDKDNMTDRTWSGPGTQPDGMAIAQSFDTNNKVTSGGFDYDPNGNMTRVTDGSVKMSSLWTTTGRLSTFYIGHPEEIQLAPLATENDREYHSISERYSYDAAGMRLVRYPDGELPDADGRPVITLRGGSGDILAEYVVDPNTGLPKLVKDFVHGAGQLLVEREVVVAPPTIEAFDTLAFNGNILIELTSGLGAPGYTIDIRTDSGYWNQLTGETPIGNRFFLDEGEFEPDEVNYIRVKAEGQGLTSYSLPVTLLIDSTVDAQSENQVRAISLSRIGTDLFVSFDLFSSTSNKTYIYFERGDTGQRILQTVGGVAAGQTNTTISDQSFPVACGDIVSQQAGTFGGGVDVPSGDETQVMATTPPPCGTGTPSVPMHYFADRYHHRDHLGSLRVVTDEVGLQATVHDYYAYGMEMFSDPIVGPPDGSARRYTGHERDATTDADYMKMRYKLASATGFMSPDPIYGGASWNRYTYVRGNPVRYTDPTGLFLSEEPFGVFKVSWFVFSRLFFAIQNSGSQGGGSPGDREEAGENAAPDSEPPCDADGRRDATNEEAGRILEAAEQYHGRPFDREGTGDNGGPISCSWLVCRAINDAGIPYSYQWTGAMPGSSSFRVVPRGERRPGDVIVWPTNHSGFWHPHPTEPRATVYSARETVGVAWGEERWFTVPFGDPTLLRVRVPCDTEAP